MSIITYDFQISRRLLDPDLSIRCEAIGEIANRGTALNIKMLPRIVYFLQDHSACVRLEALRALAKFHNRLDASVRQEIVSLLEDEDEDVRDAVVECILFIRSSLEDDAVRYIVSCLKNENQKIRRDALRALSIFVERLSCDSLCEIILLAEDKEIGNAVWEFLSDAGARIENGMVKNLLERIRTETTNGRHLIARFLSEAGHNDLLDYYYLELLNVNNLET